MTAKRTTWSIPEMISMVQKAIEKHNLYLVRVLLTFVFMKCNRFLSIFTMIISEN